MSMTLQGREDSMMPVDQSQGDQTLQSCKTDSLMQLIACLPAQEEENKTLKSAIEAQQSPPTRSAHAARPTGKKIDSGQDLNLHATNRNPLLSTGLILGRNKGINSPIHRLDTSTFDDDNDIEEIMANTLPNSD